LIYIYTNKDNYFFLRENKDNYYIPYFIVKDDFIRKHKDG